MNLFDALAIPRSVLYGVASGQPMSEAVESPPQRLSDAYGPLGAAADVLLDPVNAGLLLGHHFLKGASRRRGPAWGTRFGDLKVPPDMHPAQQEAVLSHLRALQDSKHVDRILAEIPPGSEILGAGSEALGFLTPQNTVVRVDPAWAKWMPPHAIQLQSEALDLGVSIPELQLAHKLEGFGHYSPDELKAIAALSAPMARVEHPNVAPVLRGASFGAPGDFGFEGALVEHSPYARPLIGDAATVLGKNDQVERALIAAGLKPRDVFPRNVGLLGDTPVVFDTDAVLPRGSPRTWNLVQPSSQPWPIWNPLLNLGGYTRQVRREALRLPNRLPAHGLLALLGLQNADELASPFMN